MGKRQKNDAGSQRYEESMLMRVLLDLFCGRWGWSRAFAKRGWHCIGVDLTEPPELPEGCEFVKSDVLTMTIPTASRRDIRIAEGFGVFGLIQPDAIVASPPCEEFSVHGMKHFHPHPKYPADGIRLFEHTRQLCEAAGVPKGFSDANRTLQLFMLAAMRDAQAEQGREKQEFKH